MHEIAAGRAALHFAFGIDDLRLHAEERTRRGARLELGCAGQRRDEDAAGFGLPPGVDDRAAIVADHVVVPLPCFRIDRLADGAEQAERFARGFLHRIIAALHQGADCGRRRVDDVDLVLVADLPETRTGRIIRHAFEHHRDGAVGERAIDDVAVAGNPADVCGAPVDVAVVIVEHVLVRDRGIDEITAGGVQHAFRFARRAGGIENEQRVFRVHLLARAVARNGLGDFIVVNVAAGLHIDRRIGALDDDHGVYAADLLARSINVGLERNLAPAAEAFIGGNDHGRLAVLDATGKRVGREAAEHHRMDGADAGAGEHGNRRLGNHRHVDGDAVAFLDAAGLQYIGKAADFGVQLLVGELSCRPWDRRLPKGSPSGRCAWQDGGRRSCADVQLAVLEPFDRNIVRVVRGVLDLAERLDPVDALGLLGPEAVRIFDRARIHFIVLGLVRVGAFPPFSRHVIDLFRHGISSRPTH